jgi:hypothetical protein
MQTRNSLRSIAHRLEHCLPFVLGRSRN